MKKIILIALIVIILLATIIFYSVHYTNTMIKENSYNKCPQWMSAYMWKIRDIVYSCDLQTMILRTIIYSSEPLLDDEITEDIEMPDLAGCSGIDTIYCLRRLGYKVEIKYLQTGEYDENRVISHIPSAGEKLKQGDSVEINLEDGYGSSSINRHYGADVVVQGADIFYYNDVTEEIIKTNYDFTNKEIVYVGEASNLSAKNEYLYFYSYNKETIYQYNIKIQELEEIFYGKIDQLIFLNNYIYYIDIEDGYKLKRVELGRYDSEIIIEESVTYYQIYNNKVYYFTYPSEINELGNQKIYVIDLKLNSKGIMDFDEVYYFYINIDSIYYLKKYKTSLLGPSNGIYVKKINEHSEQLINKGVLYYAYENEYELLCNDMGWIKDDRSIKGKLFGYKPELGNTCYIVGKKAFLGRFSGGFQVFDGYSIYDLD